MNREDFMRMLEGHYLLTKHYSVEEILNALILDDSDKLSTIRSVLISLQAAKEQQLAEFDNLSEEERTSYLNTFKPLQI